jgi:alpha-galactosidase/6-phospho-beta-glucosidase family protein
MNIDAPGHQCIRPDVKMSSAIEEIRQLQLRILELEKQQKEKDESDKKTSIDHNFNIINDVLTEKKTAIVNVQTYGVILHT